MNSNSVASTRCINVRNPAALKIDKSLSRNAVAYKTVIAPGEHYITPGVAVVSKLHWSLLQFKAELSLLKARAASASHSPPPCYKKSIGFQIVEEHTRLILNGYSGGACLSVCARYDEGDARGLGAPTPTSDSRHWRGLSWIFWCYRLHAVRLGGFPLSLKWQLWKVNQERKSLSVFFVLLAEPFLLSCSSIPTLTEQNRPALYIKGVAVYTLTFTLWMDPWMKPIVGLE